MSDQYDLDLFVIGGGSGGVRAARIAAAHGARVAVAEEDKWGGTCVVRGCIPKKLLVYASEFAQSFNDAQAYGWNIETPTFDWKRLTSNINKEISRLSGLYVGNLERNGAQVINARAKLVDPHTITCGEHRLSAANILVATGGSPSMPDIPGSELAISSDEAFHLAELPARIAIVGAGYIGVEFAHIFAGLGSKVTLVHRRDLVLRGFDEDIRRSVTDNLEHAGIKTHFSETISKIEKDASGYLRATYSDGESALFDQILYAVGRNPKTADLGLPEAGVKIDERGAVVVDDYSRSSVPHIFSVGDCTGRIDLTPVAIRDGHAVADALFGDSNRAIDHDNIPTAVFSQPPVATVGLSEDEAIDRGIRVEALRESFRPLRATIAGSAERVMIKIVISKADEAVLGAHMVGRDAPEIIQTLAVAIKKGIRRADLNRTMALHPTTAEEIVLI